MQMSSGNNSVSCMNDLQSEKEDKKVVAGPELSGFRKEKMRVDAHTYSAVHRALTDNRVRQIGRIEVNHISKQGRNRCHQFCNPVQSR